MLYMAGIASRAASVTVCWRRLGKNVPEPTRSADTPLPQSGEGSIDLARGAGMSTGRIWQGRVYSRPRGRDFVVASLIKKPRSKEGLMGSKRTNRRELLKGGAALAGGVTLGELASSQARAHDHPMTPGSQKLVEYGQRSRYVTSVRIQHPPGGRPSPDLFGKVFHVASPLQDSVGVITPSSLHYVATTRGSYMPDIDPKLHTLTIHGLVDQPLTLTMDDLKRFPSVTRLHFIECAGN